MNLVDPSGEKFSISAFAAGALNSFTMGASNAIAGKLFGFDPSCADWGDGYGLGVFIGDFNPRGIIKRGIRSFAERRVIRRAESPVWKAGQPYRGPVRTNGKTGRDRQYWEWDHTHNDIEVYDRKGNHVGTMDPETGEMTKPPVPGRTIKL